MKFNLEVTEHGRQRQVPAPCGHRLTVSLGSNCGDREEALRIAVEWLGTRLSELRCSAFYETVAMPDRHGLTAHPTYLNAVAEGIWHGEDIAEFEAATKDFELLMGRTAAARSRGEVPLDIDVVCVDGRTVRPRDAAREFFTRGLEQLREAD